MSEEEAQKQFNAYKAKEHGRYIVERGTADSYALAISERYEKMLSVVSGGALAISLTFLEKFAGSNRSGTGWVILIAWGALGLSLTATVAALFTSQKALHRKIEILDENWETLSKAENDPSIDPTKLKNPYIGRVNALNALSLVSFIVGLAFLITFAFLNFERSNHHEQTAINCSCASTANKDVVSSEPPSSPFATSAREAIVIAPTVKFVTWQSPPPASAEKAKSVK